MHDQPMIRQRRPVGMSVIFLAAFIVTTLVAFFAAASPDELPGQAVPSLGNAHVQSVDEPHPPYNSDPPTSGHHLKYVARWDIHTEPIPKELQVHNLEDGGVLMQYNCPQGCPALVKQLEAIFNRYRRKADEEVPEHVRAQNPWLRSKYHHLVLAPYPGMDAKIALTAWGRIDTFNEFDEDRVVLFIEAFIGIDHHPPRQFPPPNLPEGFTLPPP